MVSEDALHDFVGELPDGMPVEEMTDAILDEAAEVGWRPFLRNAVYRFARNFERSGVRHQERKAFPSHRNGTPVDPVSERQKLLGQSFYTLEYGRVTWGEARVEHHKARVEYLRMQVEGIEDTIDRHRRAVELITLSGVSCLAEVDDFGDLT